MVKLCSNMSVQCALKQTKPLLLGKMAVFTLLFCSWNYLLRVLLDYYKIGELCVIIWDPLLLVAGVGVTSHYSDLGNTLHQPLFFHELEPLAIFISCEQVEEKLTSPFSYSCSLTLLDNICMSVVLQIYLYRYSREEGRRFCSCLGKKEERQLP